MSSLLDRSKKGVEYISKNQLFFSGQMDSLNNYEIYKHIRKYVEIVYREIFESSNIFNDPDDEFYFEATNIDNLTIDHPILKYDDDYFTPEYNLAMIKNSIGNFSYYFYALSGNEKTKYRADIQILIDKLKVQIESFISNFKRKYEYNIEYEEYFGHTFTLTEVIDGSS